jgi:hypothetical protein
VSRKVGEQPPRAATCAEHAQDQHKWYYRSAIVFKRRFMRMQVLAVVLAALVPVLTMLSHEVRNRFRAGIYRRKDADEATALLVARIEHATGAEGRATLSVMTRSREAQIAPTGT